MPSILRNDLQVITNVTKPYIKDNLSVKSYNINAKKTKNLKTNNLDIQRKSNEQKQKQQRIFDEMQKQKLELIQNAKNNSIDFSKYNCERSELLDEQPSKSNNYGFLKLPQLTSEDEAKLKRSNEQKGGSLESLIGLMQFYPISSTGQTLDPSQVLRLFYDLENVLPQDINALIFFEECPPGTEKSYSFEFGMIAYKFAIVLYNNISYDQNEEYYVTVLNSDQTINFIESKNEKCILCTISTVNEFNSIKIYDNNNIEYIGDINYNLNPFGCNTMNFEFQKITFMQCDKNKKYIVPVSKKLNTTELNGLFTKTPTNFDFPIVDVTEFDKQQIKCYTHAWDFYMNDELWNNSSNVNMNNVDLQLLEFGIKKDDFDLTLDPPGSANFDNQYNVVKSAMFTKTSSPNDFIPYGFNFDKSEYLSATTSDKQKEYLRKEIIFKNEVYDSVMKMKLPISNDLGVYFAAKDYDKSFFKKVYRGMTQPFDLTRPGTVLTSGGGFVNKGFLSTSIDILNALGFANGNQRCVYEFTVMPGVPYIGYDFDPFASVYEDFREEEVLIGKNAIIHVESAPYKIVGWQQTPVIKGTISYDVNEIIAKHYSNAIHTTVHLSNMITFYYYIDENIPTCRWVIETKGGKRKTKKRRTRKTKRRRRRI
jgi:hypothetical protein